MKRFSLFLAAAVCLSSACLGEDNAARAAAEREAAEERYRLLNSAVDALTTGQADLQRRLSALAEEVRSLRLENSRIDTSKFVTREEFNRLRRLYEHPELEAAAAALHVYRTYVEPWSGTPNLVQVPLSRDGQPMRETDGGLK